MSFSILGTGSAVPEYVLTNEQLTTMVDTSDEWITSRTGIKRRHIMTTESMTELTVKAAKLALEDANVAADELDLIICATMRGDYITPSQACIIQKELGAHCPAFDVNGACSGFIYALDIADGFFARKRVEKALVVGFENLSAITDWTDRNTCVLFGDGGGALVLGEGDGLKTINIEAFGNTDLIYAPRGESTSPMNKREMGRPVLHMNGAEVYKFAVSSMVRLIDRAITNAGLSQDDIDLVIPHQANYRIIKSAEEKLHIDKSKYVCNIAEYGNTSAGCLPIAIDEVNRTGRVKRGDNIVLCAFGSGLTTGVCVIRWDK